MDRQSFMDAVLLGIAIASKDARARVMALTYLREKSPTWVADFWKSLSNRGQMVSLLAAEWKITLGANETALEAILRAAEAAERVKTNERVVRTLLAKAGCEDFDLERELEAALAKVKMPAAAQAS